MATEAQKVRIDKWLWAARFFKTRSMAAIAVTGGKVHCNGQRVKPARVVLQGDTLRIKRGILEMTVVVTSVGSQRRSAKEAAELYRETDESVTTREQQREERRLLRSIDDNARPVGRPTKRNRRLIHDFTRNDSD
ncbi:MAG: S4 domain-containing protein [Desulfobulbaceae bacterium]|nr:S4 domain-containing protein [Desulfobulbaceae bacterium]